jgi:SAM domain (Sterile alpha motif)
MSEVRKCLQGIGLDQYADAFEANEISMDLLREVDDQMLKDIGISTGGHRLRPSLRNRGVDRNRRRTGRAHLSVSSVEGRLYGRATLLIIDEGWLVLDDPTFGVQLRKWLIARENVDCSKVVVSGWPDGRERSARCPVCLPHGVSTWRLVHADTSAPIGGQK